MLIGKIQAMLESKLAGCKVKVWSPRDDEKHFKARVVWTGFEGKPLVDQHRAVYEALKELMPEIHALQIETKVSEDG